MKEENTEEYRSSSDIICDEIIRGIYSGRYSLGQRLVEADIVKSFNVGRGSVREALKRLSAEGIVTIQPHKGASIRLLAQEEALQTLVVIEALQGLAAELAAENYDPAKHDKTFERTLTDLAATARSNDFLSYVRARNRFHRAVSDLSRNDELNRILRSLNLHILRVQFRSKEASPLAGVKQYETIWKALRSGEKSKARQAASAHVRRLIEHIKTMPDSDFWG